MILIIDENRQRRNTLAEIFYYMGIPAVSRAPKEAQSELCESYSAVVFTSLSDTSIKNSVINDFSSTASRPVLGAFDAGENADIFDIVFNKDASALDILKKITALQVIRGKAPLGTYMLAGLDICADRDCAAYLGRMVKLTKTECMILRYLIASYPKPKCSSKILTHAYKPTKMPEEASVRTQISLINKKFSHLGGAIIVEQDEGYTISVPENKI